MYKLVAELIEIKEKIEELYGKLEECESNLTGSELKHPDYFYSVISFIDGDDVYLHIEDEDGNVDEVVITLEELLELVK